MNEFVSVEFLVKLSDFNDFNQTLNSMTDSFQFISCGPRYMHNLVPGEYRWICGKIKSEEATLLRLKIPNLEMRISAIPESLKKKYRS